MKKRPQSAIRNPPASAHSADSTCSVAPVAQSAIRNPQSAIPAAPPGVRLHTLPNGLVVIIGEDHSAPVVSAQAWCHTGSMMEGKWLGAGLSHVLEHMLFKGTTTRPGSRIDQEVLRPHCLSY
jgi:predicted Zn-dependent peptidase